jgi:hypothetical protein
MSSFRQRLAVSAVFVTALTVTAATGCSSAAKPGASADPTLSAKPSGTGAVAVAAGTLLVSDGTAAVVVGGSKVHFPTTVTEAAWSPDRSRIAFIDADGNVDTAHPDGTGRLVLTSAAPGVTRSRPTWDGGRVLYNQTNSSGASTVLGVYADGWVDPGAAASGADSSAIGGADAPTTGNSNASAANAHLNADLFSETAFQHKGASGDEVWVIDGYQREAIAVKLAAGSQPAVSADGAEIAYVGTDGQIRLVASSVAPNQTAHSTVISAGLSAPTHLAWSPDGRTIAFSTAAGVSSIPTDGSEVHSGTATVLTKTPGVAAYAGGATDKAVRLDVTDPVAAAIEVTGARYQTAKTYQVSQNNAFAYGAVLANPSDPAAALLGAAGQPLLFTGGAALDPRTKAELQRMFGAANPAQDEVPTITLVGGASLLSAAVETAVKQLGYKTVRVNGTDAYSVDASVLTTGPDASAVTQALVVSGDDPAATAVAAMAGSVPVLFVHGGTLSTAVTNYLAGMPSGSTVYAVGQAAQAALTSWSRPGTTVKPLGGQDAAATAALLARNVLGAPTGVVFADAADPAGQAVAASAAQQFGYALLLVDPAKGLEGDARAFLDDDAPGISTVIAAGSAAAIPNSALSQAISAAGDAPGVSSTLTYDGR